MTSSTRSVSIYYPMPYYCKIVGISTTVIWQY